MSGPDRIQSFVMIHFRADLRALVADRPAILYWTLDPDAPGAFVAHDIDRTWVFMHPFDPDTDAAERYTKEVCAAITRRSGSAASRRRCGPIPPSFATRTITSRVTSRRR